MVFCLTFFFLWFVSLITFVDLGLTLPQIVMIRTIAHVKCCLLSFLYENDAHLFSLFLKAIYMVNLQGAIIPEMKMCSTKSLLKGIYQHMAYRYSQISIQLRINPTMFITLVSRRTDNKVTTARPKPKNLWANRPKRGSNVTVHLK